MIAGRDLEAGGTWLGVHRDGRLAAITNLRDPDAKPGKAARSRGELTRDFLLGDASARDYLADVAQRSDQYLGFNLLLGTSSEVWYLRGGRGAAHQPTALPPGLYGLSNAALDVPWPKVELARERLAALLARRDVPEAAALRYCVADRRLAPDAALHGQGLSGDMARQLSAQFIVTADYGTRCTTTLRLNAAGGGEFTEQRFDAGGALTGEDRFLL